MMQNTIDFRTTGPLIQNIEKVALPNVQKYGLSNGIPVYEINGGTQEVIKLELVFAGGRLAENIAIQSRACASLMKEATLNLTHAEFDELIDRYGATLRTSSGMDSIKLQLYCLRKHFGELLPIIGQIVHTPSFKDKEFKKFVQSAKQKLHIALSKNDIIAYRELTMHLYGKDHPYGYNSMPEHFDEISIADVKTYHKNHIGTDNCTIFISGMVTDTERSDLESVLGKTIKITESFSIPAGTSNISPRTINISRSNKMQTAIRMGCVFGSPIHEDYSKVQFLFTVLGGYFGSRLMTNIREDKGYSYNISAGLEGMRYSSYMNISCEVGHEHIQNTLKEIEKEMHLLQSEPITGEELRMVKNYILGNMLSSLDGPLNSSGYIRSLATSELGLEYFEKFVDEVKSITPQDILVLAGKYLNPTNFSKILVS